MIAVTLCSIALAVLVIGGLLLPLCRDLQDAELD